MRWRSAMPTWRRATARRTLASVLAALFASPAAADGVRMTRSAALLSGFERIRSSTVLPESIDLPAPWAQAFRAMADRTVRENREMGTCLSLGTKASVEQATEQALKSYQALAIDFAKQPAAAFNAEEKRLRALVDTALANPAASDLEWLVGPIQAGGDRSVDIKFGTALCDASALGHAHTHPPHGDLAIHYPSDSDLLNRLAYAPGFLSAVVDRFGVCVLFTGERNALERRRDGRYFSGNVRRGVWVDMLSEPLPAAPAGNDAVPVAIEQSRANLGAIAQEYGGALYCGRHGEPLTRAAGTLAPPGDVTGEPSSAAMAVKATLAMARWRYHPDWPRIDFDWNDRDDPAVYRYVMALKDSDGSPLIDTRATVDELVQRGPRHLLYLLADVLWKGDEGPQIGWMHIDAPDMRMATPAMRQGEMLQYAPHVYDGAWSFELMRSANSASGVGMRMGWTQPGGTDWSLVQRDGAGLRKTERDGATFFDGPVVERAGRWVREGPTVFDGPDARYEGEFTNGQPSGPGRVLRKKDNTWLRAVRGEDGKMKVVGAENP